MYVRGRKNIRDDKRIRTGYKAALSHTRAQSNLMVERGPPRQPKIKKLSKEQAVEKATQMKDKEKPL